MKLIKALAKFPEIRIFRVEDSDNDNQAEWDVESIDSLVLDEGRSKEASEMFQIAVDETPSSYFIYGELAACYEEIEETAKTEKYKAMFAQEDKTG